MSTDLIVERLSQLVSLSPDFVRNLKNSLAEEHYKPHQVIHSAGQVETRLWLLETGFARTYYFDQTGKEHTLSFYLEKEVIFSYKGYWKDPTDYYVEILNNATLFALNYETLKLLEAEHQEMKELMSIFTRQRYYEELFKSRLMTWPAEERYHQFRKANPEIFKHASIRLIASYLNMTRENLSRLMAKEV